MNKLFIIIAICIAGCSSKKNIRNEEDFSLECKDYVDVTFEDLRQDTFSYHDKKIRIMGFFYSSFEEFAIYETPKSSVEKSGLWIDFDKRLGLYENDKFEMYSEKQIDVIGTLNAKSKGHLNQYLGELHVLCVAESD